MTKKNNNSTQYNVVGRDSLTGKFEIKKEMESFLSNKENFAVFERLSKK